MYTVRELIGELDFELFRAPTHEAALDRLDEECRLRVHQIAANGEGGRIRYHFEIRDGAGVLVNSLYTTPRLGRPTLREIHEVIAQRGALRPGFE